MKHIILIILLTLGIWGQEIGVPFIPEAVPENTSSMIVPKGTYISHLNYLEKKKLLIAGNSKGVVSFITLSPLQKIGEIKAHDTAITAMAVTPDEKYLITAEAGYEKPLKLWDTQTYKLVRTLEGDERTIYGIAVTPDNKTIITANQCGNLRWIDITSDNVIKELHRYQIQGIYENFDRCCRLEKNNSLLEAFQLSHDGKKIAIAYGYGEYIIDLDSMQTTHDLDLLFEGGLKGDFLFSIDDQSVLFSYRWEDEKVVSHPLAHYNLKSKKVKRENFSFKNRLVGDHNQSRLVGYSQGGFSNPYIDRLWNGKLLPPIQNTFSILSNLVLLKNIIALGSENNSIYFYDFNTGEQLGKLKFFDSGEWVSINTKGYFDASKKTRNFIKMLKNTSHIETIDDQSFQKYHTQINLGEK